MVVINVCASRYPIHMYSMEIVVISLVLSHYARSILQAATQKCH